MLGAGVAEFIRKVISEVKMSFRHFSNAVCCIIAVSLTFTSQITSVSSLIMKTIQMVEENISVVLAPPENIIKQKKASNPKYCIYIAFDKRTEQMITDLRLVLAHEVKGVKSPLGKMRPHVTIGIVKTANKEDLFSNFQKMVENVDQFTVDLGNVNAFNKRKNKVLFIEPIHSIELERILNRFVNSFPKNEIKSECKPHTWRPHCTLAKRMSQEALKKATDLAEKCWIPMTAAVSTVGVVDFMRPLDVLISKSFDQEHSAPLINSPAICKLLEARKTLENAQTLEPEGYANKRSSGKLKRKSENFTSGTDVVVSKRRAVEASGQLETEIDVSSSVIGKIFQGDDLELDSTDFEWQDTEVTSDNASTDEAVEN